MNSSEVGKYVGVVYPSQSNIQNVLSYHDPTTRLDLVSQHLLSNAVKIIQISSFSFPFEFSLVNLVAIVVIFLFFGAELCHAVIFFSCHSVQCCIILNTSAMSLNSYMLLISLPMIMTGSIGWEVR